MRRSVGAIEMSSERKHIAYKSPEWYELRKTHIGGSDAGAILGLDKNRTNIDVWKEKTGQTLNGAPERNAFIEYGTNAEAPLARLFALDFPQYTITAPKDIVYIDNYRMASLDLLIYDSTTNEYGIGEIKTANDFGGKVRKQWAMNHIPDKYYAQILHYFATDEMFKFAIIMAHIKSQDGEMPYAETIYRTVRRADCLDDIEFLKTEEDKFMDCVRNNHRPNTKLFI